MKKNMFPLLGIAFVVAIVSTGVFYGLFAGKLRSSVPPGSGQTVVVATRNLERGTLLQPADVTAATVHNQIAIKGTYAKVDQVAGQKLIEAVQKGEPVTERSLALKAATGIPNGMRAISIRVTDSVGLAPSIKAGTKVDLQAFFGHEGLVELRTILQDVEVLGVQPPVVENGPAIVTVLARPQDADQIALADSGAHIRVTLRNPEDSNIGPSRPVLLSSLFSGTGQGTSAFANVGFANAAATSPASTSQRTGQSSATAAQVVAPPPAPVYLTIQVLGASPAAYKELETRLSDPRSLESLQVVPFQAGTDTAELIRALSGKQDLEVVATQRVALNTARPTVWNAGPGACQFRIQFQPGQTSFRVQPEWTWSHAGGTESRRFDGAVPGGRNFLVSGLFSGKADRVALESIFPGHAWATRDLIVLVSPDSAKSQTQAVAAGSKASGSKGL
jgi:Flp pilus assembly protein CpaB